MRNNAILFVLMCVLTSCGIHNDKIIPHRYEGVKLTITTPQNIFDDVITIDVSLENNTKKNFYVLTTSNCDAWESEFFFQGTKKMVSSYLVNYGVRRLGEGYLLVQSGQTYTFQLSVNFGKFYDHAKEGEYSMKLSYYDYSYYHIKALKGRIESNILKVVYSPK